MTDRRAFLAGVGAVLLTVPRVAEGQQRAKVYRIGLLVARPTTLMSDTFVSEMQKLGWTLGRDYTLELRSTGGDNQRASGLAAELVSQPVDVLLTFNNAMARAARDATRTIPIVMVTSGYPVESGLVMSLARPGGNITGNSIYVGGEVFAKYLSLIKELKPSIRRLGVLWDYGPPAFETRDSEPALAEIRKAADTLRVTLSLQMVPGPKDVDRALTALASERVDALFVTSGPVNSNVPDLVRRFVTQQRVPSITDNNLSLMRDGAVLMAYSASIRALIARTAYFVDRILRGVKPADLPIEQASQFELIINLKNARAIGLAVPPALMGRADEVIE